MRRLRRARSPQRGSARTRPRSRAARRRTARRSRRPGCSLGPLRRLEDVGREHHPQLDPLLRAGCPSPAAWRRRASSLRCDRPSTSRGWPHTRKRSASPRSTGSGSCTFASRLTEGRRPLIAPDAEVQLGDVAVELDESDHPVRDRERAQLVGRVVPPDDPRAALVRSDREGVRRTGRAERRRPAG